MLALLAWTGSSYAEAAPWTMKPGVAGRLMLTHPELGEWRIEHWSLPAMG